ncbi:divalent-cation tolerance protein CutA [Kamptonema formosum]|uniref:divalent-cation tolerance protein CutA n=1 Tax=Kamptonema formosum TaxID=331992 RepID=UPI00034BBDB0|nr:divalent-cation tolerance protein CutA [Oscillatoria sp. PCC 10802]
MEKDSTQYGVVMVTAASRREAETIAKALLEAKLAACITLLPVQSIYTWQGKVEQNEEWQLLIKTNLTHFSALEAKVREIHSYQVPEIIALPIVAGSEPYLQWIAENVR